MERREVASVLLKAIRIEKITKIHLKGGSS